MRGSIGSKASDKKHYRGFTIVELLIVVVASSGIRYQYESSGGFSRYAGSVSFSDYTALCSSLTGSGSFERYGFSLGNGDWRNWTR